MATLREPLALTLLCGACVFPSYDPTGIEFSWLFVESNAADGDDNRRVRTCQGASASDVNITITDSADEERTRTFPNDCNAGFQTVEEFQITPSDVFMSLRSGTYDVIVDVQSDGDSPLTQEEREVKVGQRGVTVQALDLAIPTVVWTLDVSGLDTCTELGLTLRYASPEDALTEPLSPDTDGGTDTDGGADVPYRTNLESDGGLSLGGSLVACDALVAGLHAFTDVDIGSYRLVVDKDGVECPLSIRIDRPDLVRSLDLANLPCPG